MSWRCRPPRRRRRSLDREREQPVVRADEAPALLRGGDGDRAPRAAHARVDDRQVDPGGRVADRVGEHGRALADVVAGDAVGQVDHPRASGAIRAITARQTPANSSVDP